MLEFRIPKTQIETIDPMVRFFGFTEWELEPLDAENYLLRLYGASEVLPIGNETEQSAEVHRGKVLGNEAYWSNSLKPLLEIAEKVLQENGKVYFEVGKAYQDLFFNFYLIVEKD